MYVCMYAWFVVAGQFFFLMSLALGGNLGQSLPQTRLEMRRLCVSPISTGM